MLGVKKDMRSKSSGLMSSLKPVEDTTGGHRNRFGDHFHYSWLVLRWDLYWILSGFRFIRLNSCSAPPSWVHYVTITIVIISGWQTNPGTKLCRSIVDQVSEIRTSYPVICWGWGATPEQILSVRGSCIISNNLFYCACFNVFMVPPDYTSWTSCYFQLADMLRSRSSVCCR